MIQQKEFKKYRWSDTLDELLQWLIFHTSQMRYFGKSVIARDRKVFCHDFLQAHGTPYLWHNKPEIIVAILIMIRYPLDGAWNECDRDNVFNILCNSWHYVTEEDIKKYGELSDLTQKELVCEIALWCMYWMELDEHKPLYYEGHIEIAIRLVIEYRLRQLTIDEIVSEFTW